MNLKKEASVFITLGALFLVTLVITFLDTDSPLKYSNLNTSQTAAVSGAGSGLIAHYTFDDGTATDVSGKGNTATVSGATQTIGKVGAGALQFNGSSDRATVSSGVIGATPITLVAWIYPRSFGGGSATIMRNSATGLRINSGSNTLQFSNNGFLSSTQCSNVVSLNQWQFVPETTNPPNKIIFFVNTFQKIF